MYRLQGTPRGSNRPMVLCTYDLDNRGIFASSSCPKGRGLHQVLIVGICRRNTDRWRRGFAMSFLKEILRAHGELARSWVIPSGSNCKTWKTKGTAAVLILPDRLLEAADFSLLSRQRVHLTCNPKQNHNYNGTSMTEATSE